MLPKSFQLTKAAGLPVTPAALTLRELGMVIPRDWVRDMVQHALRRRRVTFSGLSTQLGRGRPGAAALREVLLEVAPGFQVLWEGILHRALGDAGLLMSPQVEVALPGGGLAVLDLALRELRLGVEIDGLVSHLDRFSQDRHRDRELQRAGWLILHFAVDEVRDNLPGVVREILHAVSARTLELGKPALNIAH